MQKVVERHILKSLSAKHKKDSKMTLLNIGDTAPDFTLLDQNENNISLSQFKGKWVVLYFYPRAMAYQSNVQGLLS